MSPKLVGCRLGTVQGRNIAAVDCSKLFDQLKVVKTIKGTPMSSAVATLYLNQQINGKFTTSCQLIEDIMYHNIVCDAPRQMATCK